MRDDLQQVADDVAFDNGYIDIENFYLYLRDGRVSQMEFEQILSECMRVHANNVEKYYIDNIIDINSREYEDDH